MSAHRFRFPLVGLVLLVLLAIYGTGSPAQADSSDPAPPADRVLELLPGDTLSVSELAYPTVLLYPGSDPVVRDELSGRTVVPRAITKVESGTRVEVPQMPVGVFVVSGSSGTARFTIDPEVGTPVEVGGLASKSSPSLWWVPLLVLPALLLLRRRHAAMLALPVLLLAAVLALARPSPTEAVTWQECDLLRTSGPRAQEVLRRDCKVRSLLEMLGPDGSGAAKVKTFFAETTDQGCHEIAHLAGYYFSRVNPELSVSSKAMLLGCNDGMVHGVLEALGLFTSDQEFIDETDAICESFSQTMYRRTCAHGVGHAMLWRTGGDLEETWSLCEMIRDERSDDMTVLFNRFLLEDTRYSSRAECKSASVMEWADRWGFERRVGAPTALSPVVDEPMDVCVSSGADKDEEMFQVGCYLGTNYRNLDPLAAAEHCRDRALYPVSCFATVGDNLAQFAPDGIDEAGYFDLALSIGKSCMLADSDAAAFSCARHLAFRFTVSVQSDSDADRLCDGLPARLREGCVAGRSFAVEVLAGKRPTSG